MRKLVWLVWVVTGTACSSSDPSAYEPGEELSGGDTTVFEAGKSAFSLAARNLKDERRDRFFVGNSMFNRGWVTAPSSTTGQDGLGPTFNANACSACHFKDGRGAPPVDDELFLGLLVRLSIPGEDAHGGPLAEPSYGGQFNHRAILGVPAEGDSHLAYDDVPGSYGDGTPYTLQRPRYTFDNLAFGAFATGTMFSPRTAPAMIGLGLLEAVDEATIVALADDADADGDGISGRVNRVFDPKTQATSLGRFGWKANQPGLEQQNSGAFLGDIGITSSLFPGENCPPAQAACAMAVSGGAPEIDADKIGDVTYYSTLLAVPARRDFDDPTVLRGKTLFAEAGCDGCHVPKLVTGTLDGFPEVSNQTIRPYTDLLLHDLGPELADDRPDFLATGTEWRTPPLWGIGLVGVVNDHTRFLHDGRARDFAEAILWHGGEAEPSREAFRTMAADDRAALVRFVESL
ncbi:MAG TPA: di-heme oxidoredictase family protein [Kofleriaceae bacterium]|nr:di-heme oxidoredictase family protein [Kofleriaceae bacterium]